MSKPGSKQQLLRRIASLVSENKTLKEKNRAFNEKIEDLTNKLEIFENNTEYNAKNKQYVYQQRRFDIVTIMYVKIHGLTNVTGALDFASEQMDKFDEFIFQFQNIVEKYKLVKLHSIGDYFICAGGIPEKNIINPISVTLAAFEMLSVVVSYTHSSVWSLNIGIHTGAVTALVGNSNNYDIKGDTMNKTSRIVSVGEKNTVVISATTYELVKELFECKYYSDLPVKYQKKLELFTVTGLMAKFADDEKRYIPNSACKIQLMLVQFNDLQEFILNKLENELPEHLYYHNVKHTVDVVTQCELIGWAEGLNDYQLLVLKTAALFHDTGHTISYDNHEERSVDIAREVLPKYKYKPEEIDEICRIIMATKMPPKPYNLLEAIICDSDLDYLGRTDFVPVSNTLYAELKVQNPLLTLNEWNKLQVKFISSHQYFTKTGRNLRNVKKQEQIDRIKQLIEN